MPNRFTTVDAADPFQGAVIHAPRFVPVLFSGEELEVFERHEEEHGDHLVQKRYLRAGTRARHSGGVCVDTDHAKMLQHLLELLLSGIDDQCIPVF
jgi:hypothetical protein